jgi:peptidoglycan/xylan/chitin deacetylase (PgdA/CDA1 family)
MTSSRLKVGGLGGLAVACLLAPILPTPAASSAGTHIDRAACRSGRVALTFDDGPSSFRPETLRILRRKQARATFFEVGLRVAANPQFSLFEAREGHLVLNHTYYHPNLTTLANRQVRREVMRTHKVIRAAGVDMRFKGVRPPFLAADDRVQRQLASVGYHTVISADVFTEDSNAATTPAQVRRTIFAGLARKAILLLHDGNIDTPAGASVIEALPSIIRGIRERGFCFGTLNRDGEVVAAPRLKPSGNPIPKIINPVPYLPLVEELRGDPPQDPPEPFVIVHSPYESVSAKLTAR